MRYTYERRIAEFRGETEFRAKFDDFPCVSATPAADEESHAKRNIPVEREDALLHVIVQVREGAAGTVGVGASRADSGSASDCETMTAKKTMRIINFSTTAEI